jgi:hypothetical protein
MLPHLKWGPVMVYSGSRLGRRGTRMAPPMSRFSFGSTISGILGDAPPTISRFESPSGRDLNHGRPHADAHGPRMSTSDRPARGVPAAVTAVTGDPGPGQAAIRRIDPARRPASWTRALHSGPSTPASLARAAGSCGLRNRGLTAESAGAPANPATPTVNPCCVREHDSACLE